MRNPLVHSVLLLLVFFSRQSVFGEELKPTQLFIQARAIETPVLKYRLFPTEAELKPGNAVPILLRLPWEQTLWMTNVFPKLHEWNDHSLSDPIWKTWNSGTGLPDRFYDEMKRAAFRRDAAWEYPIFETPNPYQILLPDVQGCRTFLGWGLSAKIRYHITRGELDNAREGILVGFSNGKHLAQTPFFINQLVAAAIHQIMLSRVSELISQPDSPNLYWALSTLPDSLLEMDRAASFEASLFTKTLPAVNDLDRPRDSKEWRRMAAQLIALLEASQEIPEPKKPNVDASFIDQFLQRFEDATHAQLSIFVKTARTELPGMLKLTAKQVAAMSDDEAAIRWYVGTRIAIDQETAAIMSLKPSEAWPRFEKLRADLQAMHSKTGSRRLEFLNPTGLYFAHWSLKRKINSLRVIEAIRHYLATHDSQLPGKLEQINDVSVPRDPLTDLAFEWKVEGNVGILKAPTLPVSVAEPGSEIDQKQLLEYHLEVKR